MLTADRIRTRGRITAPLFAGRECPVEVVAGPAAARLRRSGGGWSRAGVDESVPDVRVTGAEEEP